VSLYERPADLDDRTRSRLDDVLMSGEAFVVGARATDGLLSRWCTRVVVTTDRVLEIRHVGLDWSLEGYRRERIHDARATGDGTRLRFDAGLDEIEYDFDDAATVDRFLTELA
jgi:hypothetical protein